MHTHTHKTHIQTNTHTLVIPDGKKMYGQELVLKERWPKFTETGKTHLLKYRRKGKH